jgi:hypothetical protein
MMVNPVNVNEFEKDAMDLPRLVATKRAVTSLLDATGLARGV